MELREGNDHDKPLSGPSVQVHLPQRCWQEGHKGVASVTSKRIRSKTMTHSAGNLFLQKTFIGHLVISSALGAINTKMWLNFIFPAI